MIVKWGKNKFLVFFTVMLLFLLTANAAFAADWTKFQKDNVNSGVTTDNPPIDPNPNFVMTDLPNAGWNGTDIPPLVVNEGGVYYAYVFNSTPSDARIYKINCSDGTTPTGWTDGIIVDSDGGFQLGTPVISGTTLYLGVTEGNQNKLKKIENIASTPKVDTLIPISDSGQFNTPFVLDGNNLYFGLWNPPGTGKYYKVDLSSNTVTTFTPSVSGEGFYWAGVAIINDYLVFGGDKSKVYVVDKNTMSLLSSGSIKDIESNAAEIRSSICYNSSNSEIYFTDKGGFLWCYGIDNSGSLTYRWHAGIGYSTSTPVYDNGKIYVGRGNFSDGKIYCYNENGSKLWEYSTDGGVQSSPVIYCKGGNTYIYYTTNSASGKGYCLKDDGSSRTVVWIVPSSGGTYTVQGMAASGNYVVFGNDYGQIFMIRSNSDSGYDLNSDGSVNVQDIILVGQHFGESGTPGWSNFDINRDGKVDVLDMIAIGQYFTL
ncbi:Pyrrolo-quinoline quinone [Desulfofarcimen acetoxidans DSM 771]|jgi:hypothetical protein|uniref:Pyrrolo-quinoline quinone n=1 Tax=Desulfofarcimen acetoxidans (strain ATCC 49208 / DSM 771 / KCTC 5769 / VKM B-1644 / 5575) TaxID=485916 RepID=C8VYB5_DESAS|nr:PQQ-binding-like beta-propeller repeat protein [Desulfofarcimen acetoxidans]ACV62796.1 Pyrrolo-quinoline quinone [Desulfofarcimen acetoxidans DSM 771]